MKIHEEGFRIAMQKELQLNREQAENFYNDHRGQPYFDELISRMTMYANLMLMFYHVLCRTPSRWHYASVLVEGRLSELFCAVLCTEAVHSHKHT